MSNMLISSNDIGKSSEGFSDPSLFARYIDSDNAVQPNSQVNDGFGSFSFTGPIEALLYEVSELAHKFAMQLIDFGIRNAPGIECQGYQKAFDALEEKIQSAKEELAAKQSIYTANIISGGLGFGVSAIGGAATFYGLYHNIEGIYGLSMMAQGISHSLATVVNNSTEAYNAKYLTDAQILGTEGDNQYRLIGYYDGAYQRFSAQWQQGREQFRQANEMLLHVYAEFTKVFNMPF